MNRVHQQLLSFLDISPGNLDISQLVITDTEMGVTNRADRKSQVRHGFVFCTADFWSAFAYEPAEEKPKHCLTRDLLSALVTKHRRRRSDIASPRRRISRDHPTDQTAAPTTQNAPFVSSSKTNGRIDRRSVEEGSNIEIGKRKKAARKTGFSVFPTLGPSLC